MEVNLLYEEYLYHDLGIKLNIQEMETREIRARVIGKDGSAYIRTESKENEYWQNAHFHNRSKELYLVQSGKIMIAIKHNEDVEYITLVQGESYIVKLGLSHNIYMHKNTVVHTIKFGENLDYTDWNIDKEFNKLTRTISIL